jgi:hypothetical protein
MESVESLTWLAALGSALQVAIGSTALPLMTFETSYRAEKSFKFWPAYWLVRNKPSLTFIERYQGRI